MDTVARSAIIGIDVSRDCLDTALQLARTARGAKVEPCDQPDRAWTGTTS